MRRKPGFTLVELLAVIAILAIIIGIGIPILGRFRELARRSSCRANIRAIGQALSIYVGANKDHWPWMEGNRTWDVPTGYGMFEPGDRYVRTHGGSSNWYFLPPVEETDFNVSALLFMLVRDGDSTSIYNCPSTTDTPDSNVKTYKWNPTGLYCWDFSPYKDGNSEHLSYSYQAPLVDGNRMWRSGVSAESNAGLVVLADKTPAYWGLNPTFNWAAPGDADPATGMSQNHSGGEMVNLLYADFHVGSSQERADCGIYSDSIYSAAGLGEDGNALNTSQGPGSMKLTDHRSPNDSFLIGPKKMEK